MIYRAPRFAFEYYASRVNNKKKNKMKRESVFTISLVLLYKTRTRECFTLFYGCGCRRHILVPPNDNPHDFQLSSNADR